MVNYIWNDVCNTGHEFIDEDHKNIVKLLEKLQTEVSSLDEQQQCNALFIELNDLIKGYWGHPRQKLHIAL